EKMCEKEFQGIYFIKEYYKKLSEKVWLTGLKIHDKVAVFESYERGHCFRYVTVVRISKGWFTIIDEYDCKSKYDRKTDEDRKGATPAAEKSAGFNDRRQPIGNHTLGEWGPADSGSS
ncbi:hypothetical protein LCGC14_2583550, partial [marine sediment metagenome]